ncbi:recombinase family protein [Escherichia coli]|uniref:recombinase family protein n=1 Tax=Escherichia coli TaxID=562 RepID=UPI00203BFCA4|nr:recombinase family protein [Escherichia coli]
MGSCAAPSAKGDDKFITTDYLQQCLYDDLASGGRDDRPGLTACLKSLRDGDVLVVWKLDRLGRSLAHLVNTVKELSDRKIGLRVLTGKGAQIDTTTASGRMVFGIFATLADEDKSTPQLDLLARVERELPVRLDQERTDMVVCHGDPCMPNFMVDPKTLQCTGLIDLGRLGTADRYADLALMIANAEENWAAPDEAERAFAVLFNVLGIEAPDRERLAFYLRLDPLTWG